MDVFGRRTSGHRAHEGPLTGHKIVNSFRYAIAFERHAGETFKAATHCTGGGWKRPMHIVCKERRPVSSVSESFTPGVLKLFSEYFTPRVPEVCGHAAFASLSRKR